MVSRLLGQTSIFGSVSLVPKSPLGIAGQKRLEVCNFVPKAWDPSLSIDLLNVAYSVLTLYASNKCLIKLIYFNCLLQN